jgi:hypothetical protein
MNITRQNKKLVIDFTEDEDEILDHLIETRGLIHVIEHIENWFKSRVGTAKEEFKEFIYQDRIKNMSVKQLRQEYKRLKDERRSVSGSPNSPR